MNTHDTLAFAVASEAVRRIRNADPAWSALFSAQVFATSSRTWPIPDFVISDPANARTIAGEFKPPDQTKREYLTGLGQAVAYTRDFHYGLLVVPDVANDGFRIADHIQEVLAQEVMNDVPVGLLRYDPSKLSTSNADFDIMRPLKARTVAPTALASVESSFFAKWREMSPMEVGAYLEHLYDEGLPRNATKPGTIRDRAFDRLWDDIQNGKLTNWSGTTRHVTNDTKNKTGWLKNYRNFITHIGWMDSEGALTDEGLGALRVAHRYGAGSQLFQDELAKTVLVAGKHLVLINAVNEFQDLRGGFATEQKWLDAVEAYLEDNGLLKRNPQRGQAAVRGVERGFMKSEKTLWKNLELIVPRGPHRGRVYHAGRGFIFNWSRITSLLT